MSSYAQKQVPGGHLSPRMTRLVGMTADQMRVHLARMTAAELEAHRTDFLATIRVYDTQVMYQQGKAVNPLPLSRDLAEAGLDIVQVHLPGAQAREEEAREAQARLDAIRQEQLEASALEAARAAAASAAREEAEEERAQRDLSTFIEEGPAGRLIAHRHARLRAGLALERALGEAPSDEARQRILNTLGEDGAAARRALPPDNPARLRREPDNGGSIHKELINTVLFKLPLIRGG